MNGTNDKQRQIQDYFSPGAVKAVTKVEHQYHVPRLRGQGGVSGWMCPPKNWKIAFLKLNSRDLVHTFWQLLDTLSCLKILPLFLFFDAFVRIFTNL